MLEVKQSGTFFQDTSVYFPSENKSETKSDKNLLQSSFNSLNRFLLRVEQMSPSFNEYTFLW